MFDEIVSDDDFDELPCVGEYQQVYTNIGIMGLDRNHKKLSKAKSGEL